MEMLFTLYCKNVSVDKVSTTYCSFILRVIKLKNTLSLIAVVEIDLKISV